MYSLISNNKTAYDSYHVWQSSFIFLMKKHSSTDLKKKRTLRTSRVVVITPRNKIHTAAIYRISQ